MAKKQGKKRRGRPRTVKSKGTKSATEGLQEGLTRVTLVLKESYLQKLKDLSEDTRLPMKDIVDLALSGFFSDKPTMAKLAKQGRANQQYITVKEMAQIMDLNPITIRKQIQSGKIIAEKIGNDWLIDPKAQSSDILAVLKEG